jgi:dynein heavy chain
MKAELAGLQPILEAKSRATADLLVKVAADQEQAEKVKKVVAAEERDVKAMQVETQAMADGAKAELDEAMPALNAALAALKVGVGLVSRYGFKGGGGAVRVGGRAARVSKQKRYACKNKFCLFYFDSLRAGSTGGGIGSWTEFGPDGIEGSSVEGIQHRTPCPADTPPVPAPFGPARPLLRLWTRTTSWRSSPSPSRRRRCR